MIKFSKGDIVRFKGREKGEGVPNYYHEEIPINLIIHGNVVWNGEDCKVVDTYDKWVVVRYVGNDDEAVQLGFLPEDLELISLKKSKLKVIKYKPGMKITTYIKNILKGEKDDTRLKWLRTFENCILPDHVKDMIDEALTVVLNKDKFDEWGINEHFEKGLTNSILLYGPPGTGKTMISEAFAAVLGMNLMKVGSGDVQSNIPGKTERNIKEVFEKAKKEDCVILLDECDSLLYDRNSVGAIMASEINALLTEIENFDGVCVLTTNRLGKLDAALQRRIIAKVKLDNPTEEARNLIWKKLIPSKMPTAKLNHKKLAKHDLTGGEIKNAILLAARKAIAKNSKQVSMKHFTDSIEFVLRSKDDFAKTKSRRVSLPMPTGYEKVCETVGKVRTIG